MQGDGSRVEHSLRRFALWGQWIAAGSAALITAYGLYMVVNPDEALFLLHQTVPGVVILPPKPMLAATVLVAALPALLFLLCLLQVWQLFGLARRGQLYSLQSQILLGRLGKLAIAVAVTGIVSRTLVALMFSSANPPGQKMLLIGFSSSDMGSILVGLLVFLFATVVRDAMALAQENASFI